MDFLDEVYYETSEIWEKLYNHPVVIAIEKEDLSIDKFKFYMMEDYLYLWDHLKVFAIGILKSNEHDEIKNFTKSLYNSLNIEMDIHRKYMKDLDINIEEVEKRLPNIINSSYSNFRISKAIQGDYLDVAAILLSCDLSYIKIIEKINDNNPNVIDNKIYGRWIKGYIDPIYKEEVLRSLELFNKNCKNLSQKRKRELIDLIKTCLLFELKFWDMVDNMGQ